MARKPIEAVEISDQVRQVLANLRTDNNAELLANHARELFDKGLSKGLSFEEALGFVYLGGINDAQAALKRKPRAKANGETAAPVEC